MGLCAQAIDDDAGRGLTCRKRLGKGCGNTVRSEARGGGPPFCNSGKVRLVKPGDNTRTERRYTTLGFSEVHSTLDMCDFGPLAAYNSKFDHTFNRLTSYHASKYNTNPSRNESSRV
jgi:hypothetical protein